MASERLGRAPAIGHILAERSKRPARADYRVKQPAGSRSVAKLQSVGDNVLDAEMLRQGPHDVFQRLAYQNDVRSGLHQFLDLLNAFRLQPGLQVVLEELFAQQVQPVARNTTEHGVNYARGELTIGGVKKRAQQRHEKDKPAPSKALREGLRIPGEKRHWPDHSEVKETALHPPVDGWSGTGIVIGLFQNALILWAASLPVDAVLIVNNSEKGAKRKATYRGSRHQAPNDRLFSR